MPGHIQIPHDLIELIYDTALHPQRWPELLDELDKSVAGSGRGGSGGKVENALSSHLERAMEISHRLMDSEERSELLDSTLNQLPLAALLVDERAGIVAANRSAMELEGRQNLFQLGDGALRPVLPRARQQLLDALEGGEGKRAGFDSIALANENLSLSLKIIAIEHEPHRRYNNVWLVLIAETGFNRDISGEHLQATYGLTAAEVRLTQGLVAGKELKALAGEFEVSYNTVRSQLRSVLGKMGIQRQSELIKKVLSDPLVTLRMPPGVREAPDFLTVRLEDGRRLAWCEYGDPAGYPVLMCHASMWSRLQQHGDEAILLRHRIRLIVPDRPGFGRSDPKAGRSLTDWPEDFAELADHLGIGSFAVIGVMLGGDYAVSTASVLPDRVDHVVLLGARVSQLLCRECPSSSKAVGLLERLSKAYPGMLSKALQPIFREMLRNPDAFFPHVLPVIGPKDREIWERGELQQQFLVAFKEANRQGLAKAIVDDWRVLSAPWPFAPEEIQVPVSIWHSDQDSLCHISHLENLAERLPKVHLHRVTDGNSYVFVHQWEEAVRLLAGCAAS